MRRDFERKIGVENCGGEDFVRSNGKGEGGLELFLRAGDFSFLDVTRVT